MYKKKADLERENELLRTALSHNNVAVFDYDVESRMLEFSDCTEPPFDLPQKIEDGIQYILKSGIFDSEGTPKFKHLFTMMEQGEAFAGDIFKSNQQKQLWYNVLLTNCFDRDHRPVRVIGTFTDITERVMAELHYSKEEQFRLAMLADSRRVYEVNVTKDRFMPLLSIDDSTDKGEWIPYTAGMDMLRRTKVYRQDWEVFSEVAERENLLYCFANGKTEFYCEYRTIHEDKSLLWSSSTTHLLRDPVTNDIKGFIYVKDIDMEKKQRILLHQQAERDPLTSIYNRGAAKKYIEEILANTQKGDTHGFLSIDVDDFKSVNDTFGHVKGDYVLRELAKGFNELIRSQDVLARMGGDEFIVFLNGIGSMELIKNIADRLRAYAAGIRMEENEAYVVTISVGIAVFPKDGVTFEELYKNSDSSLYHAKHNGKNRVSVFVG